MLNLVSALLLTAGFVIACCMRPKPLKRSTYVSPYWTGSEASSPVLNAPRPYGRPRSNDYDELPATRKLCPVK